MNGCVRHFNQVTYVRRLSTVTVIVGSDITMFSMSMGLACLGALVGGIKYRLGVCSSVPAISQGSWYSKPLLGGFAYVIVFLLTSNLVARCLSSQFKANIASHGGQPFTFDISSPEYNKVSHWCKHSHRLTGHWA